MPETILVTGGAGFIGGTFVRGVVAAGSFRVVNVDCLTYAGNLQSLAPIAHDPLHHFVRADIRDEARIQGLLDEFRPAAVVHFAAESHVDRSIGAPATFIDTNVVGTHRLLEATRAYWNSLDDAQQQRFRFLHVSTDEVYGSLGDTGKFTETTPYAPNSPYSASKAASDHLVRAYYHTYKLPVLTSNCSNNYGPYQFPEKLIPLMILNAIEGKPLPIYGDGLNVRDWLHVEDHCAALNVILRDGRPGEVYNIGGNAERTNLQVVEAICQVVDELCPELAHRPVRSLMTYVQDRPGHDRRYAIDASKIETELGWRPEHRFEEGIRDTVKWYLENSAWVHQVSDGSYRRDERLGLIDAPSVAAGRVPTRPAERYVEGPIDGVIVKSIKRFTDARGWLMELFRHDELASEFHPVMAYISQTNPGVMRGPHEHVDQADYFAFVGPGDFAVYLWDSRPESPTFGNFMRLTAGAAEPSTMVIPAGVVHGYQNLSDEPGWVFNAPNRLYAGEGRREPVDEIRHELDPDSPYQPHSPTTHR